MKILAIILILLVIYYLILFFFVFKGNWQSMFSVRRKRAENILETTTAKVFEETDIMGKGGSYIKIATVEIIEPLEIDMEVEYATEPDEYLDEEAIQLEEQGFSEYSAGVTFEELHKVVEAVQNEDISEETEVEAGEIISNLGQTDMFELLSQFSGGQEKVDCLLKRHVDRMKSVSGNGLQLDLF